MRKRHADPEFAAANAERAAERMRKLNADPEFKAKVAPVRFDRDEALRRVAAGETQSAVAKSFGVSRQAVSAALIAVRSQSGASA